MLSSSAGFGPQNSTEPHEFGSLPRVLSSQLRSPGSRAQRGSSPKNRRRRAAPRPAALCENYKSKTIPRSNDAEPEATARAPPCRGCGALRDPTRSQPELLDRGIPRVQAGRDDADGGEHRDAAVVQLARAHLLGVVVPPRQRVPEVAGLLLRVLHEHGRLQAPDDREDRQEPHCPLPTVHAVTPFGTPSMPGTCATLCTSMPKAPIIARRPCLSSLARKSLNFSSLSQNPSGSQKPSGACAPSCSSLAKPRATRAARVPRRAEPAASPPSSAAVAAPAAANLCEPELGAAPGAALALRSAAAAAAVSGADTAPGREPARKACPARPHAPSATAPAAIFEEPGIAPRQGASWGTRRN